MEDSTNKDIFQSKKIEIKINYLLIFYSNEYFIILKKINCKKKKKILKKKKIKIKNQISNLRIKKNSIIGKMIVLITVNKKMKNKYQKAKVINLIKMKIFQNNPKNKNNPDNKSKIEHSKFINLIKNKNQIKIINIFLFLKICL